MDLISHEYKSIFIHIPKNGGTTISNILLNNNWNKFNKNDMYKYINNYYIFLFIRNPYSRFLSGWKRTMAKMSKENKKMNEYHFNIDDFKKNYKLIDFYNNSRNKYNLGTHFYYTQTKIIKNYNIKEFNKVNIFKFENFNENLKFLFKKFNIDININNINKLNESQKIDYNEWLNDEIINYINLKYKDDFINFNYELKKLIKNK